MHDANGLTQKINNYKGLIQGLVAEQSLHKFSVGDIAFLAFIAAHGDSGVSTKEIKEYFKDQQPIPEVRRHGFADQNDDGVCRLTYNSILRPPISAAHVTTLQITEQFSILAGTLRALLPEGKKPKCAIITREEITERERMIKTVYLSLKL